jgi:glycosyltransferase involved in cell wall biosynthesis
MKFVFWQNIVSMHQVPFLKKLAQDHVVCLFVESYLDEKRISQGWSFPNTEGIIIKIVNEENYESLLNGYFDYKHFFSGIYGYPIISKALISAMNKNLFVGIIAEPQNWIGIKGILRRIRSKIFFHKYHENIALILAIGSRGKWWYKKVGFPEEKIYEWGYTVEEPSDLNLLEEKNSSSNLPTLLFIGRLVESKGIRVLIDLLKKYYLYRFEKLIVIGDGPDASILKRITSGFLQHKFIFHGNVENKRIWEELKNADFLILPSTSKDGWGAVINEALISGVPVITNDYCGASALISDKNNNGFLFDATSKGSFKRALNKALLSNSNFSNERKIRIKNWSKATISPTAFKDYFENIIYHALGKKNGSLNPPWY